jgi:proline dehydrogenase
MSLFTRLVVFSMPLVPKPIVRFVAGRYVAGETLDLAMKQVRNLNEEGAVATMDVLGESVTDRGKALEYVQEYMRLLDRIDSEKLEDTTVSLKPTMLGLDIEEQFCLENIDQIVRAAKNHGIHITIDMEDRNTTDATLRMYKQVHAKYTAVGTVLQAYMRRTLADIDVFPDEDAHLRICKGIYIEPRTAAWKDYDTIRANFIAAMEKAIKRGIYTCIATHDEHLVWAGMELVDRYGLKPDQYEFQMLLGVDHELRKLIISQGHKLRVYVPYGKDWYPYSTRRLRENPEISKHIIRAFFGLR